MNWAWASLLDYPWHSPSLPMWITLAAVGFVALILLVTLFRAEKSVATGALAVITLLAIGITVAATAHNPTGQRPNAQVDRPTYSLSISVPALSCLDGLAGDAVEAACEKPLFASAESSAAAVSYTAAQMTRLANSGGLAPDKKKLTPELSALRRTIEHDRYGLVAHVLSVRDGCTPLDCAFYALLTDHNQISANMNERVYEGLIGRYALGWNAPPAPAPVVALAPSVPTGRPMSGDFPSANSIPPVSIMTGEPPVGATAAPAPKPVAATPLHPPAPPAPKKPVAKKPPAPLPPAAPPPQQSGDNN